MLAANPNTTLQHVWKSSRLMFHPSISSNDICSLSVWRSAGKSSLLCLEPGPMDVYTCSWDIWSMLWILGVSLYVRELCRDHLRCQLFFHSNKSGRGEKPDRGKTWSEGEAIVNIHIFNPTQPECRIAVLEHSRTCCRTKHIFPRSLLPIQRFEMGLYLSVTV